MSLKLFCVLGSPPSRSTLLTVAAIGLDIEIVPTNPMAGDTVKPEFLKLNPLHTIPTIQDGDFSMWDSHAINAYLVGKYAQDDSLYPKDLQKRAIVDQRLHFDSSVIFPRLIAIIGSIFRQGAKTVDKEKAAYMVQAYTSLETLLDGRVYVAGNQLTIADFNLISSISTANIVVPIAENRFPNISSWISKMQSLPYYAEANQKGLDQLAAYIKSKLA